MGRRLASLQAKGTGPIFTEYLEAGPAAADAVVLRFETGEPALMEHSFGRGRAMVFAGAPGPAEAWRAFARGLLRYASTEAEPLWHPIGEPVRVESGQGVVRSARLRGRSDDRWRELSLPDDQPPTSVLLPPQDEAGLYEVELTTDAGTEIRPLALNIDPEETTPRRLSVGELAGRLPGVPCRVLNGAEQLRTLLTAAGRVVDLNQDLVPMLLVLLVLELLLAGRLYGRAPEAGDAHQRTRQIRQVR